MDLTKLIKMDYNDQEALGGLKAAIRAHRRLNHYSIYDVSPEIIGKRCKDENLARNEYGLGKRLSEGGIPVPEMYDLVRHTIRLNNGSLHDAWYILMQRLQGEFITNLRGSVRAEAERQYRQELEKVLDLGICPRDSDFKGNNLLAGGKVYLIDFEAWYYAKDRRELDSFYERIRRDFLIFRV